MVSDRVVPGRLGATERAEETGRGGSSSELCSHGWSSRRPYRPLALNTSCDYFDHRPTCRQMDNSIVNSTKQTNLEIALTKFVVLFHYVEPYEKVQWEVHPRN